MMTLLRGKYYVLPPEDDESSFGIEKEADVERLRAILKMMTPETGSQALGAKRQYNMPASPQLRLVSPRNPQG